MQVYVYYIVLDQHSDCACISIERAGITETIAIASRDLLKSSKLLRNTCTCLVILLRSMCMS